MNRLKFLLTLLVFPIALIGCSDSTGPNLKEEDYIGGYTLSKVNGQDLPQTVTLNGDEVSITVSNLFIDEGKDWRAVFVGENLTTSTEFRLEVVGDFTTSGKKFTFVVWEDGSIVDSFNATFNVDEETMTLKFNDISLLFLRGMAG